MLSTLSILKVYESSYILSTRIEKKKCHANINYSLHKKNRKKICHASINQGIIILMLD